MLLPPGQLERPVGWDLYLCAKDLVVRDKKHACLRSQGLDIRWEKKLPTGSFKQLFP